MGLEVGAIVTGKVATIKEFGAFINLENGQCGLLHISEVAHTYVETIREHLQDGQEVTVKVIAMDEGGRIKLSIKQAQKPPARPTSPSRSGRASSKRNAPVVETFEDKLQQFMQESNRKISDQSSRNARRKPRG